MPNFHPHRTDWFHVLTGTEELKEPKYKGMTAYCPVCKYPVGSDVTECKYKEQLHNYKEANNKIFYARQTNTQK